MTPSVLWALLLVSLLSLAVPNGTVAVGVCYGMLGDNLPSPPEAVGLIRSVGFKKVRLYWPDGDALNALRNTGIKVNVGVDNRHLHKMADDTSYASSWISSNIKPYLPDVNFRYITVGNEVIPGDSANYVLPAMRNMVHALRSAGLEHQIKVSTSVSMGGTIDHSYPPSEGSFKDRVAPIMGPIVRFLARHGAPLMVNVYPYFSYMENPQHIQLDYALFTANRVVVTDPSGLQYTNLFDAMVDAVYSALERAGAAGVQIQVSETGWPSAGGDPDVTTITNAHTYNQNLVKHAAQGTPKRRGPMDIFVFALFNENEKKPAGVENNWGLFYPDKQPVYPIKLY